MQDNLINKLTHILSSSQSAPAKSPLSAPLWSKSPISLGGKHCYHPCTLLPFVRDSCWSYQSLNLTLQNRFAVIWWAERWYLSPSTSCIPNSPNSRLHIWRKTIVITHLKSHFINKKYASFKPYPNAPSKYIALSSIRSITPLKFPSRPIGIWTKAALCFNLDLKKWGNID